MTERDFVTRDGGTGSTRKTHEVDLLFKWGFDQWKVICSCGWESWAHPFWSAAARAHTEHVERETGATS